MNTKPSNPSKPSTLGTRLLATLLAATASVGALGCMLEDQDQRSQDDSILRIQDDLDSECLCLEVFDPVCGVDEQTYSSECHADCAGVEIDYYDACIDCLGEPPNTVCGNDGLTYDNPCVAGAVGVAYAGPCRFTCADACERMVGCGALPPIAVPDCIAGCEQDASQDQLDCIEDGGCDYMHCLQ